MSVFACPYCSLAPDDIWMATKEALAVSHPHPLTQFHIVVFPRRHVPLFYDLDVQEQRSAWSLVGEVQKRIAASLQVTGFDIGFEEGAPEAENPAHTKIHVVPRVPGQQIQLPAGIEWVDPQR